MAKQASWIGLLKGAQPGIQINDINAVSVATALQHLPPLTDPVSRHEILAFIPALAVATEQIRDDPIDAGMAVCPSIRALLPGSPLCERMLTCIDEHHWRLAPDEMAARLVMEAKRQIDQMNERIAAARASHPEAQNWPVALISDPDGLRIPSASRGVVLPERWQAKESVPEAGIIAPSQTIIATPQGWRHWETGRWSRRATGSDLPPIV